MTMLTFGVIRSDQHQTVKFTVDDRHFEVTAYKGNPMRLRIRGETEDYRMAVVIINEEGITVAEEREDYERGNVWEEEVYRVDAVDADKLVVNDMTLSVKRRSSGMTVRIDKNSGAVFYLDLTLDGGLPAFTFGGIDPVCVSQFLRLLLENKQR